MEEQVWKIMSIAVTDFLGLKYVLPSSRGIASRRDFVVASLDRTVSVTRLPKGTTCCICQESLKPTLEARIPAERPVRLPCGHVLGQDCAKQWFNTLFQGQWNVPEEFNATCPYCRAVVIDMYPCELLNDVSRSLYIKATHGIMGFLYRLKDMEYEQAVDVVRIRGGLDLILDTMDKLLIVKWYIFRRFRARNEVQKYSTTLVHSWWEKSLDLIPRKDWSFKMTSGSETKPAITPEAQAARRADFQEKLRQSRENPPAAEPRTVNRDRFPELDILKDFTDPRMLPSSLYNTALDCYGEMLRGLVSDEEVFWIHVELLGFAFWPLYVEEDYESDDD